MYSQESAGHTEILFPQITLQFCIQMSNEINLFNSVPYTLSYWLPQLQPESTGEVSPLSVLHLPQSVRYKYDCLILSECINLHFL